MIDSPTGICCFHQKTLHSFLKNNALFFKNVCSVFRKRFRSFFVHYSIIYAKNFLQSFTTTTTSSQLTINGEESLFTHKKIASPDFDESIRNNRVPSARRPRIYILPGAKAAGLPKSQPFGFTSAPTSQPFGFPSAQKSQPFGLSQAPQL